MKEINELKMTEECLRRKMNEQCWITPDWLAIHFKNHFDPCPVNPTFDGLKAKWRSPAYVNPPYYNPLPWVQKAIEESKKGIRIVMLLRVDPTTKWYRLLIENKAKLAFFNTRISFKKPDGKSAGYGFYGNMLVFL